jgi:hypothetical protein
VDRISIMIEASRKIELTITNTYNRDLRVEK